MNFDNLENVLNNDDLETMCKALHSAQCNTYENGQQMQKLAEYGGTPLVTAQAAEGMAEEKFNRAARYYDIRRKLEQYLYGV